MVSGKPLEKFPFFEGVRPEAPSELGDAKAQILWKTSWNEKRVQPSESQAVIVSDYWP